MPAPHTPPVSAAPSPAAPSPAAPSPAAPSPAAAGRAVTRDTGATHRTHLAVEGVSHAFPDRRVLSDVTFAAAPGDRIGLIGENGTGKSTLLRILAGELRPDRGTVSLPGSVGLLAQELPHPPGTTLAAVLDEAQRAQLDGLAALAALGERLAAHPEDPATAEAYAEALEAAERTDAWSAEAQRGEMLSGLGLGGISPQRAVGELSGGQRLRLALAALLLRAPHTLLLDEPSNHLDDASAAYLEGVLAGWPGIVIVASHDRALLDAVTTRILDLDPLPVPASVLADAAGAADAVDPGGTEGTDHAAAAPPARPARPAHAGYETASTDDTGSGLGARMWGLGYSAARSARQAELERWRQRYATELAERERLIHEIEVGAREVNRKHESKSEAKITRKFYADKDARVTARRARNARVRLDALEGERVRRPPEPLRFGGFAGDRADPPVPRSGTDPGASAPLLRAEAVAVPGRLRETTLTIPPGHRLMLTGPNGAGKSTLLAILAGELRPHGGAVHRGAAAEAVRIGYLPQEVDFADPSLTAAAVFRTAVGEERADEVPLGSTGLLARRDLDRPVGALSVGQRRRLALAALVADPPPLLLLDEPSNHLSLTLVEELEAALGTFPGALVIATHDRWLRARWRGDVLALEPPG